MKRIVPDNETCPTCGGPIIYWLPEDITIADVPNRLKAVTTLPRHNEIDTDSPMHAGRYCQSGCFRQLFNFGNDGFWERFEAELRQRENASLIVKPVSHDDTPLHDFRIYLDRRWCGEAPRNRGNAPKHCVYIQLEPGEHTIIVRDHDYYHHRRPDRRESNALNFAIEPHSQITVTLSLSGGQLQLKIAE
jgi:hypothetical protein